MAAHLLSLGSKSLAASQVIHAYALFPKIQQVDVYIDGAASREMAALLCACCPNLKALYIEIIYVSSAFVRALTLPCLSTLFLKNGSVDSISSMVSAIECHSSLKHLRLDEIEDGGREFGDVSIPDVIPLASLSRLQSLCLLDVGDSII